VDVRVLSASNRSLQRLVRRGRFREDLFYRLNTIEISVPPLRERLEDFPFLIDHFLHQLSAKFNRQIVGLAPDFLDRLYEHSWPGNVREFDHVLTCCAVLEEDAVLKGASFTPDRNAAAGRVSRERGRHATIAAAPRDGRQRALEAIAKSSGNKSKAAVMLGISRKTLYCWLKRVPPRPTPPR
jgi:transcriptional regulator with PAS, ATPase and Fis domain